MADDLDKKIKQIADMFGVSDTSGLKNIVESLAPSDSGSNQGEHPPESDTSYSERTNYSAPPYNNTRNINLDFLSKANEMLGMFNNVKDSRINLLYSIQPFLGTQRQQRLGGAVQLLKIIAVISSIAPPNNRNTKG